MDSRISIKADFNRNTPFIEVVYKPSDDVRDDMVKAFTEKLQHTSHWATVEWQTPTDLDGRFSFRIYPILPEELEDEQQKMQESLTLWQDFQKDHHS